MARTRSKAKAEEPTPDWAPVEAIWTGPTRFFPSQGIVEAGDRVTVTREQLEDPNTPCKPVAGDADRIATDPSDVESGTTQEA